MFSGQLPESRAGHDIMLIQEFYLFGIHVKIFTNEILYLEFASEKSKLFGVFGNDIIETNQSMFC